MKDEAVNGKQIPLELHERPLLRESLLKTWKAETAQLMNQAGNPQGNQHFAFDARRKEDSTKLKE